MKNFKLTEDKIKDLKLTNLEVTFLEALIPYLDAEPGFSDVSTEDIVNYSGINSKSIRGVISSLVKKNIIWMDEDYDRPTLVQLERNFWYIHPIWNEIKDQY